MIKRNNIILSVKLGTSGFSYQDWRNHFYPPEIPKSRMLPFYCRYFQTVEINSSYYAIPSLKTIRALLEKTPDHFEFIFKTNRETTHVRKENRQAMLQLITALQPLSETGKLKGLLAQFPYSFKNKEKNRRYLAETKKYAATLPLFVEFRHASWNTPQLVDFLKEHDVGYVNVDEPQIPGLLPPQAIVTTDTGYIRFHGRNAADWWSGKGSARYDYSYSREELKGWLTNISQILQKTYKTYIFFNNHPRGQAIRNVQDMSTLLNDQLQLKL